MKDYGLEFYESIEELPLQRFNAFNKYVMLDSELGNTVQDFDKMVVRVSEFMSKEMYEDARAELMNMRIVYHNVLTENDVKGLAFASTIKRYKGKDVLDYSEENLRKILDDLEKEGLTVKEVVDKNNDLKKK